MRKINYTLFLKFIMLSNTVSAAIIDKNKLPLIHNENELPCFIKSNQFSLFGDFLYFKALEDSINYAEKIPQDFTFTPKVNSISQRFDYEPGFRIGAVYEFSDWEVYSSWMRYYIRPPARKASDNFFGILSTLSTPVWGALGNDQTTGVKGSWHLNMDVIDALVRRNLCFKGFTLTPLAGVKFGLIEQKIEVEYEQFLNALSLLSINPTLAAIFDLVTPRDVSGKSSFWGIGPTIGLELSYLLPKQFRFFLNGNLSCLIGTFHTKTLYKNFTPEIVPEDSEIKIKDSNTRTPLVEQLQAGISKRWESKHSHFEMILGWEVQVWQKQMYLNYFSTFVSTAKGSDLSLYGPFFRVKFGF